MFVNTEVEHFSKYEGLSSLSKQFRDIRGTTHAISKKEEVALPVQKYMLTFVPQPQTNMGLGVQDPNPTFKQTLMETKPHE
jgi:hypothetical protein